MTAIDLSKQQALDVDPKAIQKINFTGNLAKNPVSNTTMLFVIKGVKENTLVVWNGGLYPNQNHT